MEIVIDGKTYEPARPKARVWRELMEFYEHTSGLTNVNYIDAHAEIIATVFARPEVTAETILDNIAIDDIVPLYLECHAWLSNIIHSKLIGLPNETTPAESEI